MRKTDETDKPELKVKDAEEWKPTSRAFRRAAKKGNFDLKLPDQPSGGNRRTGGKKKW
jgi:hypothetical protein